MSVGIKCDACGHINPVGRLFCAKCGAQLNVSRIVADSATRKQRKLRIVRSVILLALLIALVQLLRPAPMEGATGGLEDANRLVARLNRLYDGVQERRFVQELIHEAELNAYLAGLMAGPREEITEERLREGLASFRVRLSPGQVRAVWATKVGALPITYRVEGAPRVDAKGFRLEGVRVHAGHLPLPGPVGAWAAARLYRTVENLESERNLLNALAALDVVDRKAMVVVGGRR